jgi:hypothetical protein
VLNNCFFVLGLWALVQWPTVVRAFTAIFLLEGKKDFRSIPQPVGLCMKDKSENGMQCENLKICKSENERQCARECNVKMKKCANANESHSLKSC